MLRNGRRARHRAGRKIALPSASRDRNITVALQREGAEVVIVVEDDGGRARHRRDPCQGASHGLLRRDQQLTDEESLQLILEAGLQHGRPAHATGRPRRRHGRSRGPRSRSSAAGSSSSPTPRARRALHRSGCRFTLAITQSLIVRVHDEFYALR